MGSEGTIRRNGPRVLLWALVAGFVFLAMEAIETNEIMVDEYAHLPAGISYFDLHRFYLYRVNPPLVQGLAALPVWLTGPKMDYSRAGSGVRSEWNVGADFLRANVDLNRRYFSRARSVVTVLAIACGVLIYRWSSEIHGRAAAVVGASLWFMDPNVLAHSTVVTTDIGAATFGLAATYVFWHFLRYPTWKWAIISGVALGLAQGSKFSLIALYPAWLVLAALAWCPPTSGAGPDQPPGQRPWTRLAGLLGISLLTLNMLYTFDGSFSPLGSFGFRSQLLTGVPTRASDSPALGNRFADTMLAGLPIPFPKDYVLGIDTQKWEGEIGSIDLRDGRLIRGGRWDSPIITLLRKLPVGSLLLLGVSVVAGLAGLRRAKLVDYMVWVPILVILAFLCSERSLNWAIRYALIVFPFLFVAVGKIVRTAWQYRLSRLFIVACLMLNAGELLVTRPYYLSFGNRFVGGIDGAQRTFLGSNFDWGQDLLRLKRWCDEHPQAGPIALSYYGVIDAKSMGVPVRGLPSTFHRSADGEGMHFPGQSEEFYWAISSNVLHGLPGIITLEEGSQFLGAVFSPHLRPENAIAKVGSTIYIFRIISSPEGSDVPQKALRPEALEGCILDESQLADKVMNNRNFRTYTSP
jgi:Dolichyl-phosphate-mannose-protein mannosyltransferase